MTATIRGLAMIVLLPFATRAQTIGSLPDSAIQAFYSEHAADYADERQVMASARARVTRSAGELRLRLENGQSVVLVDTLAEGDNHHRFLYAGYEAAQHLHVVQQWFYEGSVYLLIDDRTGRKWMVPGRPIFAPNGRRFLSASLDLEAGYDPNCLEIWSAGSRGLHKQFVLDGGQAWGPDSVSWITNDLIHFVRTSMNQGTGEMKRAPRWLVWSGKKWRVTNRPR